jgi:hypothetical protein
MKTLAKIPGRRIQEPPAEWDDDDNQFQAGDYWKASDGTWHCVTPNGLLGWLKNHHVEEHEDGTISVVQGPWGSNSILVKGCSMLSGKKVPDWHGCIVHGEWREF